MSPVFFRRLALLSRSARNVPTRSRPLLPRRPSFSVPQLESLEGRIVPSTLTVTSAQDPATLTPGTLRYEVQQANIDSAHGISDRIIFDTAKMGTDTITLHQGQLTLTGTETIDGAGVITISGNNASRVFDIQSEANVTIKDTTIADGYTTNTGEGTNGQLLDATKLGGGGILNEAGATLNLVGSTLAHNVAAAPTASVDVFGGGLLNEGTAVICGSTFSGNKATGGGNPNSFFTGSEGGGIDNYGGGNLTVTGSTFVNNQALGATGAFGIGGAIESNSGLDLQHASVANIRDSLFTGNVAGPEGNGGAVDNEGTGSTMTITHSVFVDNQSGGQSSDAFGSGGGLENYAGSTMHVISSAIVGNQSIAGGGMNSQGGGITNQSATMTISSSNISGNQAIGSAGGTGSGFSFGEGLGGGIFNGGFATLTIEDNSTVIGNQALGGANSTPTAAEPLTGGAAGGGIENLGQSTLKISNSSILFNVAQGGSSSVGVGGAALGGGIENNSGNPGSGIGGSSVTVTCSTVSGNLALGGNGSGGGGLAAGGGLDDSTDQGASTASTAQVMDSTFTGNQAVGGKGGSGANGGNGEGGGIAVGSGSLLFSSYTDLSTLKLSQSSLDHNLAQGGDGGNNGGNGLGGGLAAQLGTTTTISQSKITHNLADGGEGTVGHDGVGLGGGIYDLGVLIIDNLTDVHHNHASTSGDNIFT